MGEEADSSGAPLSNNGTVLNNSGILKEDEETDQVDMRLIYCIAALIGGVSVLGLVYAWARGQTVMIEGKLYRYSELAGLMRRKLSRVEGEKNEEKEGEEVINDVESRIRNSVDGDDVVLLAYHHLQLK